MSKTWFEFTSRKLKSLKGKHMKNISPTLLNFLQTHDAFNRFDLVRIALTNGQLITATIGQLTLPFGYTRSAVNPLTNVSDNFLRADGVIGVPWVSVPMAGDAAGEIHNHSYTSSAGVFWAPSYYSGVAFGNDQFAEVTFHKCINSEGGVLLRAGSGGNGYIFRWGGTLGNPGSFGITPVIAGTQQANVFVSPLTVMNVDDVLRAEAKGTTLNIYQNGVLIGSAVDGSVTSGSPGIWAFPDSTPSDLELTNWSAGSDSAISYPDASYYPTKFGTWERGKVTSEVTFIPKSHSMDLTVSADATVLFPGTSLSMMKAIAAGLFDAATVTIFTLYGVIGGALVRESNGEPSALITFSGKIANFAPAGRSKVKFTCVDMLYLLNYDTPPNVIQSSCRFQLFDQGCTLVQSSFALNNSVAAGSDNSYINLSANVNTAGFWNTSMTFTQGTIHFTSGANIGLWYYIKSETAAGGVSPAPLPGASCTQIQLARPLTFPALPGDTFVMYPGCDKTLTACTLQYNNLIHIGAMPFVPNPEMAV